MKKNTPTLDQMDRLIAFLPIIYGTKPVEIGEFTPPVEDGVIPQSFPIYDEAINRFFKLASGDDWKDPDFMAKDVQEMLANPQIIMGASIDDIRSMLTHCVRGEKFVPGYRADVIKSGQLKQILERLVVIRALANSDAKK